MLDPEQKKFLSKVRKEYLFWGHHHGIKANQLYESLCLHMLTIAGIFITFSSGVIVVNVKNSVHGIGRGFLIQGLISLSLSILISLLFLFFLHQWNLENAKKLINKAEAVLSMEHLTKEEFSTRDVEEAINAGKYEFKADWVLGLQAFLFILGILSIIIFAIIQIS